jgi:glucuronate isomerase
MISLSNNTPFISEDWLLDTSVARTLYHEYAAQQPIIDYHNHLPPQLLAEDHHFPNLHAAWLAGDHYKWRGDAHVRSGGSIDYR